jgi:hypothetical protein
VGGYTLILYPEGHYELRRTEDRRTIGFLVTGKLLESREGYGHDDVGDTALIVKNVGGEPARSLMFAGGYALPEFLLASAFSTGLFAVPKASLVSHPSRKKRAKDGARRILSTLESKMLKLSKDASFRLQRTTSPLPHGIGGF